ncbi:BsuPI-related putative proteinase inhibitor [Natronoglomus mannanivorans]|uniref:Intracellular proteinase inhibitor BsuPI domain-containing protein n=1 Tax=Natronoglomus mannanivorans TaxID=2979990 RepID=A0AAP3E055_9EURY|nr:BsuPI-related putative proteinase inhibitor [Halobacteria archaeon AArc-xg1-1]
MTLEGELDVSVSADGNDVRFAFTVHNTGSGTADLQFPDACKADFAVLDEGREVWRFTDGRVFAQMIGEASIPPGESITYDGTWDDPQNGEFTAVAELCARNEQCEARAEFSV